jgi:hypothetical protein
MTMAIREAVIHHRALVAFTESLQTENDTLVGMWEKDVRLWEQDPLNVTCPYDIPEESKWINLPPLPNNNLPPDVTWAVVKRQLAVEDHLEVEAGKTVEGDVTASAFIVAALELEDAQ